MTTITQDYFLRMALPSLSHPASMGLYPPAMRRTATDAASSVQSRAFPDLDRIARDCANAEWDGYRAEPISRSTCDRARAFLKLLPTWMIAPDIVPEADGDIAIEWYVAPRKTFSISIGANGPLHYAGLLGHEEEAHGVVPFTENIPETLLRHISEIVRSADARIAT